MPDSNENENLDDVKIYSNEDDKLEFLGKSINTETGRKILKLLFEDELTPTQIKSQTGYEIQKIAYHLDNMVKAEIVVKTRISITKQKQPTTHYKAKEAIIILSRNNLQMTIKDKHFQSTIKKILKIGVVCMPTLAIFLLTDFQVFFEFEGGPKASTNLPFLSAPIATLVISIISYKIGSYLKKRFK